LETHSNDFEDHVSLVETTMETEELMLPGCCAVRKHHICVMKPIRSETSLMLKSGRFISTFFFKNAISSIVTSCNTTEKQIKLT